MDIFFYFWLSHKFYEELNVSLFICVNEKNVPAHLLPYGRLSV
jgi:hypothetical protein